MPPGAQNCKNDPILSAPSDYDTSLGLPVKMSIYSYTALVAMTIECFIWMGTVYSANVCSEQVSSSLAGHSHSKESVGPPGLGGGLRLGQAWLRLFQTLSSTFRIRLSTIFQQSFDVKCCEPARIALCCPFRWRVWGGWPAWAANLIFHPSATPRRRRRRVKSFKFKARCREQQLLRKKLVASFTQRYGTMTQWTKYDPDIHFEYAWWPFQSLFLMASYQWACFLWKQNMVGRFGISAGSSRFWCRAGWHFGAFAQVRVFYAGS